MWAKILQVKRSSTAVAIQVSFSETQGASALECGWFHLVILDSQGNLRPYLEIKADAILEIRQFASGINKAEQVSEGLQNFIGYEEEIL